MANEHDCDGVTKLRDLRFFRRGSPVSPEEIFTEMYSPLTELIRYNNLIFNEKNPSTMSMGSAHPSHDKHLEQLALEAGEGIQKVMGAAGTVAFTELESGEKATFKVSPRTNYYKTLLKTPNIIYLLSDCGSPDLVLREARTYGKETQKSILKLARSLVKNNYRGAFSEKNKDAEGNVVGRVADTHLVPEPNLVLALEQASLEGTAQRFTPLSKVAGVADSSIWSVRNFLPTVRDSPINPAQVADYFGSLHGLGLMDNIDMQLVHYCLQDNGIVNIDPDFMLFARSKPLVEHQAWGALKGDREWNKSGVIPEGYLKSDQGKISYRTAFTKSAERLGASGFARYIPDKLAAAPALRSIFIGNPEHIK